MIIIFNKNNVEIPKYILVFPLLFSFLFIFFLRFFSYSFRFIPLGTERCPQKGVVKQVSSKLVRALSEKGLALLVNHGIPECKVRIFIHIFA